MANTMHRLDLNLLVTLNALLNERSVTKTAQQLHLSQPAVSLQLSKLRGFFDDPLLVSAGKELQLTLRAQSLQEPLGDLLDALDQKILQPVYFDPTSTNRTWRLAASDYAQRMIIAPLFSLLSKHAPASRLAVHALSPTSIRKQMEEGQIELAFHTADEKDPNLHYRPLYFQHYALWGRHDHSALHTELTLDEFCGLEFAIVSPNGGGFSTQVDSTLTHMGRSRSVVLSVPHFLALESMLINTQLVSVMPTGLFSNSMALKEIAPPLEIAGFEMGMSWHERVHRDPGHRWLRKQIIRSFGKSI